jgi:hypothetical protein
MSCITTKQRNGTNQSWTETSKTESKQIFSFYKLITSSFCYINEKLTIIGTYPIL